MTIVGYGSTETDGEKDIDAGTKRLGRMRYKGAMNTPENATLDGMGMLHPEAGVTAPTYKSQNACGGDSGGAAVLDDGVYGVLAKVLAYKDGKVQEDAPTCADSNITFIAEIPRQVQWIREVMDDYCSEGGKVPEYFGPSGDYEASKSSASDGPVADAEPTSAANEGSAADDGCE